MTESPIPREPVMVDGYLDFEATERERFLQLETVGEVTAEKLVERYHTLEQAASYFLRAPTACPPFCSKERADTLRDVFEEAGFTPPCECGTYEDVHYSQRRDDVRSHCETCGEVLKE